MNFGGNLFVWHYGTVVASKSIEVCLTSSKSPVKKYLEIGCLLLVLPSFNSWIISSWNCHRGCCNERDWDVYVVSIETFGSLIQF